MFCAKESMEMHIILEYFPVECNPYSLQFIGLYTPYFCVYFTSGCVFAFKSKGRFPSHSVMKWNVNFDMYSSQC
jgi:hypothetical protein